MPLPKLVEKPNQKINFLEHLSVSLSKTKVASFVKAYGQRLVIREVTIIVVKTFTGATFFVAIVACLNEFDHLTFLKCAVIEDGSNPKPEEDGEKPSRYFTKKKCWLLGVSKICR